MKSELSVVTLSEYDHMQAGITLGTVYDAAKEQMYISICLQDSFGYAMSDRDIHIAVPYSKANMTSSRRRANEHRRS